MTTAAIAAVLERIAAIERQDGYEGPEISIEIAAIQAVKDDFDEQLFMADEGDVALFPTDWLEDVIVGAVARGCHGEGWYFAGYFDVDWSNNCEATIGDPDSIGRIVRQADSLALAALLAWEAAISSEKNP